MIEPVKTLRKAMVDAGTSDTTNYIQIRPDDRDGKMRIRADIKPKEGNSKFVMKATWPCPPMMPKSGQLVGLYPPGQMSRQARQASPTRSRTLRICDSIPGLMYCIH